MASRELRRKTTQLARHEGAVIAFAGTCCLLFLVLGLIIIRYPGVQNDEALFGAPLFPPRYWLSSISTVGHHIPIMLASYLGTVKTFIYWPWFHVWSPSPASIRLPALLAGTISVWLFFLLACRTSGRTVAALTTLLLATDVSFLFTSCFDWGPVALQHLLLVSGLLLLVKFHQEGAGWALAASFFLFGLGIWDKALFVWMLAGLVVAAACVYPREILRCLSLRRVSVGVLCFGAGALPLIGYNLKHHAETARANISVSASGIDQKIRELQISLDGSVMLEMAAENADHPHRPQTSIERLSTSIYRLSGENRTNFNEYGFLAAIMLLPLLWRTPAKRPMLFSLVFTAAVWTQMALTAAAGTSVHHVILLWPFPLFFIAVAFTEMSKRLGRFGKPVLAMVVGLMAAQNLLIYNTCLERLIRNGATGYWTDAIYPLAGRLYAYQSNDIDIVDWGMINSLRLLDHGRLRLENLSVLLFQPQWRDEDRNKLKTAISNPDHIFVNHINGQEAFRGVGDKLLKFASDAGYERRLTETVTDSNGRTVFELFRFQQVDAQRLQAQ